MQKNYSMDQIMGPIPDSILGELDLETDVDYSVKKISEKIHFASFEVEQEVEWGITQFMKKIGTGYSMYFNIKYQKYFIEKQEFKNFVEDYLVDNAQSLHKR